MAVPSRPLADPDYNIHDAIEFWDLTNRQDWDIVEQSQLGGGGRGGGGGGGEEGGGGGGGRGGGGGEGRECRGCLPIRRFEGGGGGLALRKSTGRLGLGGEACLNGGCLADGREETLLGVLESFRSRIPEVELTGAGFYVEFDVPSDAPRGAARFHGRKREHHPEGRERRGGLCSSFGMAAWRPWKATLPRDHGRRNPTPFSRWRGSFRFPGTGQPGHVDMADPPARDLDPAILGYYGTAPEESRLSTTPFRSSRLAPVS